MGGLKAPGWRAPSVLVSPSDSRFHPVSFPLFFACSEAIQQFITDNKIGEHSWRGEPGAASLAHACLPHNPRCPPRPPTTPLAVLPPLPAVAFIKGTKQFPSCGFSNTVVQILNNCGAPYVTVNVLEDELLRSGERRVPRAGARARAARGCVAGAHGADAAPALQTPLEAARAQWRPQDMPAMLTHASFRRLPSLFASMPASPAHLPSTRRHEGVFPVAHLPPGVHRRRVLWRRRHPHRRLHQRRAGGGGGAGHQQLIDGPPGAPSAQAAAPEAAARHLPGLLPRPWLVCVALVPSGTL